MPASSVNSFTITLKTNSMKIKVRSDLKDDHAYGDDVFIEDGMGRFKGKWVKATKREDGSYDVGLWHFTPEMITETKH